MLRIDLEDFELDRKYAKYGTFTVGPESSGYKLKVSGYTGNAGNNRIISCKK